MNNKNNMTRAVIISTDKRLKQILVDHASGNDEFKFSMENNLANLHAIRQSDAYIYDVELTNSDIDTTIAAIRDLKKIIATKPLILIGTKTVLTKVLSNNEISKMVDRTVNKPISYGQLQLTINSCLLNSTPLKHSAQRKNRSTQHRIVVASLITAFVLLGAFTYLKSKQYPGDINISSETTSNTPPNIPILTNTNPVTPQVEQLNQLALLALKEDRLIEPTNNSVSYYLKKIKNIDPYNTTANQTHKELFARLEASYLYQSQQGDYAATKKAIEAVIDIEPYNHKYAQLLRELKERNYLENLSKSQENPSESKEDLSKPKEEIQKIEIANLDKNIELTPQKNTSITTQPKKNLVQKLEKKPEPPADNLVASIRNEIDLSPEIIIKPAEVLKRTEPYYPKLAVDLNYEGWIELEYQIDAQGQAINIKVVNGEKIKTFEKAAIQAIEQWEFSASIDTASNTPVLSDPMTTKFNFSLD